MRISDWSSDVCSSDLEARSRRRGFDGRTRCGGDRRRRTDRPHRRRQDFRQPYRNRAAYPHRRTQRGRPLIARTLRKPDNPRHAGPFRKTEAWTMATKPKDIIARIKATDIAWVDMRFTDHKGNRPH